MMVFAAFMKVRDITSTININYCYNVLITFHCLLKHGPHWALFNLASLYWRSIGDGWNTIECLRRAIHFAPNKDKDIGYIGLANTLQRHGYLSDSVLTARAALDIRPDSVS